MLEKLMKRVLGNPKTSIASLLTVIGAISAKFGLDLDADKLNSALVAIIAIFGLFGHDDKKGENSEE